MANSSIGKVVLQRIRNAYFVGLSIIVVLILAKQIVTPIVLDKLKCDSKLIFLASNQPLLCQKLVQEVEQSIKVAENNLGPSSFDNLKSVHKQFKQVNLSLKFGDEKLGINQGSLSDSANLLYNQCQNHFRLIDASVSNLTDLGIEKVSKLQMQETLARLLPEQKLFTEKMNEFTKAIVHDSESRINNYKLIELLLCIVAIVTLTVETIFIFFKLDGKAKTFLNKLKENNEELHHKNAILELQIREIKLGNLRLKQSELELQETLEYTMQLKEAVRERERQLEEAQAASKIGDFIYNIELQEFKWSRNAGIIFGQLKEQVFTNSMFYTMLAQTEIDKIQNSIALTISTGSIQQTEFSIYGTDNKYRWMKCTLKPIIDNEGACHTIIGTIQDISNEFQIRTELNRAKEEAELATVAKSQFLSTMSHEIRTPMNAVLGFSQLIMLENKQPELSENLKILEYSAKHLLSLINDILDFSKIESGKLEFEQEEFSLQHLLESVLKMFQLSADEKDLKLLLEYNYTLPYHLVGDTVRLNQVLTNLVGNAIKFTEKGQISVGFEIENEEKDFVIIKFKVADTGIGIPEKLSSQIFYSFTQAKTETTRKYGGTGLGLAICKRLVELQGGAIWVESQENAGSTFYFTLKLSKGTPLQNQTITQQAFAKPINAQSLEGVKMLLVEDNAINQLVAKQFLNRWNAKYEIANNGLEAVAKVQETDFDLILMDLQMPEMDGYQATKAIRSLGGFYATLPIIALTASVGIEIRENVRAKGLSDAIAKPFVANDLYKIITRYLNKKTNG